MPFEKEYYKIWYAKNKEKISEYGKKYRSENKEKRRELNKKWAKNNPDKIKESSRKWAKINKGKIKNIKYLTVLRARYIARDHIKLNDKICELCGEINDLHRHHPDYNKPLEVMILCRKCHLEWHRNNKAIH